MEGGGVGWELRERQRERGAVGPVESVRVEVEDGFAISRGCGGDYRFWKTCVEDDQVEVGWFDRWV